MAKLLIAGDPVHNEQCGLESCAALCMPIVVFGGRFVMVIFVMYRRDDGDVGAMVSILQRDSGGYNQTGYVRGKCERLLQAKHFFAYIIHMYTQKGHTPSINEYIESSFHCSYVI